MAAGEPRRRSASGALAIDRMIPDRMAVTHMELGYRLLRSGVAGESSGPQMFRAMFRVLA
jgi:hypothetical protein